MNHAPRYLPPHSYALLADGTTVALRPARPGDLDAVRQMHEAMSQDNSYLRFFGLSTTAAGHEAVRVCRPAGDGWLALLAWLGAELVGVASYETAGRPDVAEIAFAVADHAHGRGIAMLLLEHLVSAARSRGVRTFTAQTLAENSAMLRVFADTGLQARRQLADGVTELTFDLPRGEADPGWDRYLDAVASRESHSDVQSLRHLLAAQSVAVVGTSAWPGSPGQAILDNIISGGYQGRLYAVSPGAGYAVSPAAEGAASPADVSCLTTVAALPEPVDLAVLAVPAARLVGVARQCGRSGARTLMVITGSLDDLAGTALLATCRRHGMRLVGPGCLGVVVPGIGLAATLSASHLATGHTGLAVQSAGAGVTLLERFSRLGLGISSFASLGDKYDVSGNDLLMWWEQDPATRLVVLCLESYGNPRKFARIARRAGRAMPVLTVHPAIPLPIREALFGQAGIVAVRDADELLAAAALLASQPVPAGRRVAVVSSDAGTAALAAGACAAAGLDIARLGARTAAGLRRMLPPGAAVAGPAAATAAVPAGDFRRCLEQVAADAGVDAVLAVIGPAAIAALVPAACSADTARPLAVVVLGQSEAVRLLPRGPGEPGTVPAYARAESAACALAHAARYGLWRARPAGRQPEFGDVRFEDGRALIRAFLARVPAGGWLPPADAAGLLDSYGIGLGPAVLADGQRGTELTIAVVQEPVFGPVILLGPAGGGTAGGGAAGAHAARLSPLTDTDADELIRSSSAAPQLPGHHDTSAAGRTALAGLLMRVSRLADDVPELAELEISPVIAGCDGAFAVGARIRLTPGIAADPFLRRLR